MKFIDLRVGGAFVIEPTRAEDERGFFARTFCEVEFGSRGLPVKFVQCSTSFTKHKGTIRGMHYQAEPHEEEKLVRCTAGEIFDVILDLRMHSATYLQWVGVELSARNSKMIYIPKGVAHGFQTMSDNAEVYYQMTECYRPASAKGVRWNDSAAGILWPLPPCYVSSKDKSYADLQP